MMFHGEYSLYIYYSLNVTHTDFVVFVILNSDVIFLERQKIAIASVQDNL